MRVIYILLFVLVTATNAFHIAPLTTKQPGRIVSSSAPAVSSNLFRSNTKTPLYMSSPATSVNNEDVDPLIVQTSEVLGRVSWLSWWAQVILTVIASVTLLFARNVTLSATPQNNSVAATIGPGFVLAGAGNDSLLFCMIQVAFLLTLTLHFLLGIIASAVSIFWTWGAARLSRRFRRNPNTSRISAANMLRRAIQTGCTINLLGMAATLLGAEQIVGSLAIKVLTQSGIQVTAYGQMPAQLQPLDILIVQANTNTLLSHFCSLCGFLWMVRFIKKLDPPSKEGSERGKRT